MAHITLKTVATMAFLVGAIMFNSCTDNPAAAPMDVDTTGVDTVFMIDTISDTITQIDTVEVIDTIIDTLILDPRDTVDLAMVYGTWLGQGGEWETLTLNEDGTCEGFIGGEIRTSNWAMSIDTIYFNEMPLNELRYSYIEYVDGGEHVKELSFYNQRLIAKFHRN